VSAVPPSVLIVDDDVAFRDLIRRLLTVQGLSVVGDVGTVAEALAAAESLRPDAVLVDVGLPDGDGIALGGRLSRMDWSPRVVLTSTDPAAADGTATSRSGAVGFLPKDELAGDALRHMLVG
jgi:DNA-binding NarL/FixJ family response regulator